MARRDRQKQLGRNGNGIGTPLPVAIALLPTPMAGDFGADRSAGPVRPSGAKRQTGLPDVIIHRLAGQDGRAGPAEPGEGRLLPTPDTGCSPNGHGRRGGRPGNGHQSGQGLDVAATALTPAPGGRLEPGRVGGVRAGDPPLGGRPRVPRAAARRAGAVGPAPAVGPVRRVDDGHPRDWSPGCPASPAPAS